MQWRRVEQLLSYKTWVVVCQRKILPDRDLRIFDCCVHLQLQLFSWLHTVPTCSHSNWQSNLLLFKFFKRNWLVKLSETGKDLKRAYSCTLSYFTNRLPFGCLWPEAAREQTWIPWNLSFRYILIWYFIATMMMWHAFQTGLGRLNISFNWLD